MQRAGRLLGCVLLVGPGLAAAPSGEASNPYAVISERNVFHLNPIPPAPLPEKPKLDLPVIKLSGFFKVGSETRALFSSEPKKKEEGPKYYNLAQGEKATDGVVEVVRIDEENGKVDILNSGTPVTLTLKEDSLSSAPAAAAGGPAHTKVAPLEPFPRRVPALPDMPMHRPFQPGQASAMVPGSPGGEDAHLPNPMRPRRIEMPQ